ncbi:MAG: polysaccharide deacetylase family protein [Bacteroidota bacterium]|nr:polysaccharide deacetylase family protein [Bacteroidota bacterium]
MPNISHARKLRLKKRIVFAAFLFPLLITAGRAENGRRHTNVPPSPLSKYSFHPTPSLRPVLPRVVSHGLSSEKTIALTFDACSTHAPSRYDERITEVLVKTHTPATIFLGGKWMEDEPAQTKYLSALPFIELENHTFYHPHLTKISNEQIREELRRTQEAMYTLIGRQPTLFRPPYGEYDKRVETIAAALGLTTVEYSLASGDPDPHFSKEVLIKYVTTMARNGSIIVMHINGRGWHTAEALPEIIARLRARGFTFVTVKDLIHSEEKTAHRK